MAKSVNRLLSLDIFRGMTIAFMIIVNNPGSWQYVYPPLRHAEWHGCTPTDLVYPFFLFIVGVSMWYSMRKYGHELNTASFVRVARRTLIIFALGLLLAIFPYFARDYSSLRIMGVLQRIALAYGLGALICLAIRKEYLWIVAAVLLLLYWGLLYFLGNPDPYSLEGNIVLKVDEAILGINHMYKGYGIPFEPEGLLSTMPSIATVIMGYYSGEILGRGVPSSKISVKMILVGIASIGLGFLWGIFFPINKPLWTSSYVLYSGGIAMVVLAVVYYIADVLKWRKWGTFFRVFGTNALFAYFMAGIWTKLILYVIKIPLGDTKVSLYSWLYENVCVPVAGNMNGSLLFAILHMLFIWLIVLILYRKNIMIKV